MTMTTMVSCLYLQNSISNKRAVAGLAVVVTGFVSSTNQATLCAVNTGIGVHLWLVYHPGIFRLLSSLQSGPLSVDRCNEYW